VPFAPQIATRKAYGLALAKLGHANQRIIALDGDTKNSTFSDLFRKEHPERFIECYIAEQNMVSIFGEDLWAVSVYWTEPNGLGPVIQGKMCWHWRQSREGSLG